MMSARIGSEADALNWKAFCWAQSPRTKVRLTVVPSGERDRGRSVTSASHCHGWAAKTSPTREPVVANGIPRSAMMSGMVEGRRGSEPAVSPGTQQTLRLARLTPEPNHVIPWQVDCSPHLNAACGWAAGERHHVAVEGDMHVGRRFGFK
jgi:hypothetical protein